MSANTYDPLEALELEELARLWRVSVTTVAKLIREGELESVKVGRRRLVPRVSAEDYLRRHSSRDGAGE